MRAAPAPLADFRRDPGKTFDYLTRKEIDEIVTVVRDLADHEGGQDDAMSEGDSLPGDAPPPPSPAEPT